MTLVVSWVRTTLRGAQEVLIASDSRLSGGGILDCSPKIIQLPRSDAIMAFSGDTYFAYPMLTQVSEAINAFRPLRERVVDYNQMRTHVLSILNNMVSLYQNVIKGLETPDAGFILAGYSWFNREFCIDQISFDHKRQQFVIRPCKKGIGNFGKVSFSGDWSQQAYKRLLGLLQQRYGVTSVGKNSEIDRSFHMEPFEVLRDCLRETGEYDSIGGSPQIISVSQHMNSRQTAVYWPNKENGVPHLGGRPIFDNEYIDCWILDPDTLEKSHQVLSASKI
ncbi:TPA: hypothetical protein NKV89_004519 [Vibrio parahaemolyticus]|nr:hypothetical protein [Vibrio parahaemolyticus]